MCMIILIYPLQSHVNDSQQPLWFQSGCQCRQSHEMGGQPLHVFFFLALDSYRHEKYLAHMPSDVHIDERTGWSW
jgi:hypothetical protein